MAFALEISSDVIQRALEPLADFFDFVGLDHQRRGEYQPIADHTQDQSMTGCCGGSGRGAGSPCLDCDADNGQRTRGGRSAGARRFGSRERGFLPCSLRM